VPRARFDDRAETFFRELVAMGEPHDRWTRMTRNQLLHQYGTFLALAQLQGDPATAARIAPLVELARGNYYSLTGIVEPLTEHGASRDVWARAAAYLDEAERLRDDSLDRERLAREYYLRGFLAFRHGDLSASQRFFELSATTYPDAANGAHAALRQLAQARAQRQP
jgi:hypothetical protein